MLIYFEDKTKSILLKIKYNKNFNFRNKNSKKNVLQSNFGTI